MLEVILSICQNENHMESLVTIRQELFDDCEGTSQCILCCVHWNPKKKEWIAPYDPNCENCGDLTCDGTGLVDA